VAVCSLLSVSIAFRHLSATEFGLWTLVFQINSYLLLADFGISNAVGRFLMDWKDRRPSRSFGSIFIAGFFLCLVQAGLVVFLALLVASWGPDFFRISPALQADFRFLIIAQAIISGLLMPFRIFTFALVAYGRFDWINLSGALGQIFSLAGFAWGIQQGWGIRSYLVGTSLEAVLAAGILGAANRRLKLAPIRAEWSCPTLTDLQKILKYGRDMFMILIGNRLLYGSQALILARFASLEQVALWSVGSKMFLFFRELANQFGQSSGPGLIELYQQGELPKATLTMRKLACGAGVLAVVLGCCLITWNKSFVTFWTHGALTWESSRDFFLSVLLLISSLAPIYVHAAGMTKNLRVLRWATLAESTVFIILGCFAATCLGIDGMILAFFISTVLVGPIFILWVLNDFNQRHGSSIRPDFGTLIRFPVLLAIAFLIQILTPAWPAAIRICFSTSLIAMFSFFVLRPIFAPLISTSTQGFSRFLIFRFFSKKKKGF